MNIFEFMSDSPFLTFFIALIVGQFLIAFFCNLPNRILRHRNIRMHGYPPEHCDADGDFRKKEKEE